MAHAGTKLFLLVPVISFAGLFCRSDEQPPVGEIMVEATSLRPNPGLVQGDSVVCALENLAGVALNSQGGKSVQNDIGIRGSSFSEAGLSLGGLSLINPQTEHFNMDLHFPSSLFRPPRVVTGLDRQAPAPGHLAGTVDLQFMPTAARNRVEIGGGQVERSWQNFLLQVPVGDTNQTRKTIAVFGSREEAESIDFDDNNLFRENCGLHFQLSGREHQTDIAAAFSRKEFGARGYYGVTSAWPAEEKLDDNLVVASSRSGRLDGEYTRMSAMWRSTRDQYTLFWTKPGTYENIHRAGSSAIAIDGRLPEWNTLSAAWRAGAETELIRSARLGNHSRNRGDLMLAPEYAPGNFRFTGGARARLFSGDKPAILPLAGVSYSPDTKHSLFASWTGGARQPSYTELNYESPGSLGNSGLEIERSDNIEAGWHFQPAQGPRAAVAVFNRKTRHTVDWIKETSSSAQWVATDIGDVNITGVELSTFLPAPGHVNISAGYTWLTKDIEGDWYAGRYVLDYPRHLFSGGLDWQPADLVSIGYLQTLRWQEPARNRSSGKFGCDGRAAVTFSPRRPDGLEVILACDNLWNNHFEVFPGQPVADRRVSLALAWNWE